MERASFAGLLGGLAEHQWSDVAVGADGTVVATLSSITSGAATQTFSPGVYRSDDDGLTWTDITPSTFPSLHHRSVIALAPSNPDAAYVLTFAGSNRSDGCEDVRFHKIVVSTGESEDRTASLPNFPAERL